jgi:hypothetical protein
MLAWMVASVGLSAYALWRRDWWMLACALPCVLLAGAEVTGWYPASPRMRLFARPAIVLAAVRFAEREVRWAWVGWVPGAVAVVWMGVTVAGYRTEPFENYAGAMAELRAKAGPGDLVLVHAGARQGFLLETAIEGWQREVTFGGTGWPCCARGRALEKSSEAAVRADLERMIPADYRGRVWLVYANRPLHWQYLGLDEGDLWRRAVWERGCPPAGYTDVGNAVVAPMECNSR